MVKAVNCSGAQPKAPVRTGGIDTEISKVEDKLFQNPKLTETFRNSLDDDNLVFRREQTFKDKRTDKFVGKIEENFDEDICRCKVSSSSG
ncbi:MAG: hypothetical protein WCG23_09025 [bacterium]